MSDSENEKLGSPFELGGGSQEGESELSGPKVQIPSKLPVLMLRDIVVFPYMIVPLFVGREKSKNAIDLAL